MRIEEAKWDYLTGQRIHLNNLKRMKSKYDSNPKQEITFSNPTIDNWVRLGNSLTGETFNGVSRKTFYEIINEKEKENEETIVNLSNDAKCSYHVCMSDT